MTDLRSTEDALREREAQYRGVFEATSDGLVINDLDGNIVDVNPAMCRMHGYSREELLSMHPTVFVHPDYHQVFAAYVQTVKVGGQFRTRAVDVRKDGTLLHVAVQGTTILYQGRRHILGVVRDVTEQVQAYTLLEQRVAERTRELSTLLDVAQDIASTLEMQPLLSVLLDRLKIVVEYTGCWIGILDGEELRLLAVRGPIDDDIEPDERHFRATVFGPLWAALQQGQPVMIDDVRAESPEAHAYQEAVGERFDTTFQYVRSWLAVPLTLHDRVIGMLTLTRDEPGYYRPRHAKLALAIAHQAALAIENARLFAEAQGKAALEERQRLARDLHDSVSQTLFSAGIIAEVLPRLWDRRPEEGRRRLEELRQLTRGALAEMRTLLLELRPDALTEVGLGDLLRQLADATTGRARLPVELILEGEPRRLPPEVQVALYRIAQEALNNVVKHARADAAAIALCYAPEHIRLVVRDDGRGFTLPEPGGEHLGLRIMRERAAAIEAQLTVQSRPGLGAHLTIEWPGPTEYRRHDSPASA